MPSRSGGNVETMRIRISRGRGLEGIVLHLVRHVAEVDDAVTELRRERDVTAADEHEAERAAASRELLEAAHHEREVLAELAAADVQEERLANAEARAEAFRVVLRRHLDALAEHLGAARQLQDAARELGLRR